MPVHSKILHHHQAGKSAISFWMRDIGIQFMTVVCLELYMFTIGSPQRSAIPRLSRPRRA